MNTNKLDEIPHRCVLGIHAVYDNLKTAEKKAVDYLLSHPEKIATMTVADFAERADCSVATVVRFAKRLGYKGYPELKKEFAEFTKTDNPVEYDNISANDSAANILKKVFQSSICALQDTLNMIDQDNFMTAVDAIATSEKIAFTGFGDAGIVAAEAQQKFSRAGKIAYYSPDPDIQLIYISQLKPGDILLAISHSGRTQTVINSVKAARKEGIKIISITNFPVSILTKNSDIVLQTAAFVKSVSGEIISKRLTALCIIESLYLNWLMVHQDKVLPILHRSNGMLRANKLI